MQRLDFLTSKFYEDGYAILDLLNDLYSDPGAVAQFEMYSSGEFLTMDVNLNPQTRGKLISMITDIDAFQEHTKKYHESDDSVVCMDVLVQIAKEAHRDIAFHWWDEDLRFRDKTHLDADPAFAEDDDLPW